MEGMSHGPALAVFESVRCLACGTVYAKPSRGGTTRLNPGCPDCGYVGWLPQAEWLREGWPRDRFGADRRPRPSAQSG